jgi:hypothetical protein
MNTIMDGFMLALAFLVIVAQLPYKENWVANLWFVDLVMFVLVIGSTLMIRSTHWALVAVYGGFMFTVMLRFCRSIFWRKYFVDDEEKRESLTGSQT